MKGVIMNITIAEKNEIVAGVIKEMVKNKEFMNSLSKIINSLDFVERDEINDIVGDAIEDQMEDYATNDNVDEAINDALDELVIGRG